MEWKTQYCQDCNSPQIDLYIQHNAYQNSSGTFVEIDKLILKFIWKCNGIRIAKTALKKNSKVGGLMFPEIKMYCKTTILMEAYG